MVDNFSLDLSRLGKPGIANKNTKESNQQVLNANHLGFCKGLLQMDAASRNLCETAQNVQLKQSYHKHHLIFKQSLKKK